MSEELNPTPPPLCEYELCDYCSVCEFCEAEESEITKGNDDAFLYDRYFCCFGYWESDLRD